MLVAPAALTLATAVDPPPGFAPLPLAGKQWCRKARARVHRGECACRRERARGLASEWSTAERGLAGALAGLPGDEKRAVLLAMRTAEAWGLPLLHSMPFSRAFHVEVTASRSCCC